MDSIQDGMKIVDSDDPLVEVGQATQSGWERGHRIRRSRSGEGAVDLANRRLARGAAGVGCRTRKKRDFHHR